MSLNARQIGELVNELRPLLVGWRVKDLAALPPRDIVLVFERPAGAPEELPPIRRLRVSADPDHSRLHLQVGRVERHDGPAGPFFRRLADELVGASLRALTQVRGDRIACLEFRDAPSGEQRFLFAELTGRHANLVLAGRGERVLEVLVPAEPGRKDAAAPRLVAGSAWAPPPGKPPAAAAQASVEDELGAPRDATRDAPLSMLVEGALSDAVGERDRERAQRHLEKRAARKLSKARGLATGLAKRLAACDEADRLRMDGELLTANAHKLQRGMREVVLEDWYVAGAPPRRIELDPKRNPSENAERLFERYKKLERSRRELPAEIERARRRVERLEELIAAAADPERDPVELEAEAVRAGLLDPPQEADLRKRKEPAPRLPYRSFAAARGSEVRVGRSARDNDALTLRHARGNDVWLHTADAAGSHVVLVLAGRTEPDPEELLDAAHLAVHFSPLRGAGRAAVHVCRRKEVHKPRGAKPGLVTVSGGRKLELRMQPERLERLLSRDRDGEASGERAGDG